MIKVEHSLVVMRPIEEVFSYHENPENQPKWETGVLEYEQTSEGPVGVGATYRDVRKFMGRRIESISQITEYIPNKKFSMKTISGPIPFEFAMTFESVEGGTKITIVGEAEVSGFFKLAEPILSSSMQRQIEGNFANMKDLVEAKPVATP